MMGATDLPPRFPCWCKATYSWGGETKKDLGFIEGDLIEALNAGDGSWWMGRLRRDPRAIGLFPSNFVQVLDESFKPVPSSRNASPLTQQVAKNASPVKSKSVFRKPFQAYETAGRSGSLDGMREKQGTPEIDRERKEKSKLRPYSSMKPARAPAVAVQQSGALENPEKSNLPVIPSIPPRRSNAPSSRSRNSVSINDAATLSRPFSRHDEGSSRPINRSTLPMPERYTRSPHGPHQPPSSQPYYKALSGRPNHDIVPHLTGYRPHSPRPDSRASSPALSRSPSPLPNDYRDGSAYAQFLPDSQQPSPSLYHQQRDFDVVAPLSSQDFDNGEGEPDSSPPPPPPAHRVAYRPGRAPSPQPYLYTERESGAHTPVHPSPNGSHMTPSPLRDAINDVMMSLQDMSASSQSPPPATLGHSAGVWSPDAFEVVRTQSQQEQRHHSSMAWRRPNHHYQSDEISSTPLVTPSRDELARFVSYTHRMEHQLQSHASFSDRESQHPLETSRFASSPLATSSSDANDDHHGHGEIARQLSQLKHRKSAYELGRGQGTLDRTFTTKTNVTNSTESSSVTQSSASTQLTSRSIMSGASASGFSATSAGSLARHKFGMGSQHKRGGLSLGDRKSVSDLRSMAASETSGSGLSYHESHASDERSPLPDWTPSNIESGGLLGGLNAPKARKSGFFKKMIESAKTTARTGAATARSTIASTSRPSSRAGSPTKGTAVTSTPTGFGGGGAPLRPTSSAGAAARDMGLGGGEWMQVRRDINRSNSLCQRELEDRVERCELLGFPAVRPIEQLHESAEGDEGLDGLPINEPIDFNTSNLALVDKSTRFLQNLPPMTTPSTLAHNYICRPHKSDVQRLRAIFTWVAERIAWEDDFEGEIDTRRVVQVRRGCSEEIAALVVDMCSAVGLHAEMVRGYLKRPGEVIDTDTLAQPNHWWNAVIVDGQWRIMDCSLANPTHPRRNSYSSVGNQAAESWYFLVRPLEICYTHIPLLPEQQHIVPPVSQDILIALPCATPAYFRQNLELSNFDTSILQLENFEMAHIHINVPEDIECIAETSSRAFAQDADGDLFESGEMIRKQVLSQPNWIAGRKQYTIKALLPTADDNEKSDGQATLHVFTGKKGLMHSVRDNPYPLAVALPLSHTGMNPPYDFVKRHPTPHAQRHDLYVVQPQCRKLTLNNTFVFAVRQHPSSLGRLSPDPSSGAMQFRPSSPNPTMLTRPGSAMSMVSASASASQYSDSSSQPSMNQQQQAQAIGGVQPKPAKLAIQTPSQKIIRLTRKVEHGTPGRGSVKDLIDGSGSGITSLTTNWETVIKIGEKGIWRGLVLADRSARWCVFAEWVCE